MKTLTTNKAAKLLHLHPVTLRDKARALEIPGAKVGSRWVFIDVDLIEWLRSNYKARTLRGDTKGETKQCHYLNAKTVPIGGLNFRSVDDEYKKALGLKTKMQHKSTTTG